MTGDADIAKVGALLAEPARARILMALSDGRALPASVVAAEAGIAPSTASGHLARLREAHLLKEERHGRHRYFRIAGRPVAELIETIARVAPPAPVRSLRQGTRAEAVRSTRLCYDHVAGRLGTALMQALLQRELLSGGDGTFDPATAHADHLSAPGRDLDYRLTDRGDTVLRDLGIDLDAIAARRRPAIRYCVDWSEQRHHLAGALGAALAARMIELRWVRRATSGRALHLTDDGRAGLHTTFGLDPADYENTIPSGTGTSGVRATVIASE